MLTAIYARSTSMCGSRSGSRNNPDKKLQVKSSHHTFSCLKKSYCRISPGPDCPSFVIRQSVLRAAAPESDGTYAKFWCRLPHALFELRLASGLPAVAGKEIGPPKPAGPEP